MPSLNHEVLVELFRNRPELACELLAACAGIDATAERIELGSIDLSQAVPAEYRADAVVVLRDHDGAIVSAVIVEVQLHSDAAKHLSWPAYVTVLRSRLEGPVALLVVTDDPAVARWARQPIETGHPGFVLEPIVIALADVPRVTALRARETPELAVLSAIAHPELETARVALVGISLLPDERNRLYLDIVLDALPSDLRKAIGNNAMLKNYEYQSDFARKYYGQGKAEGKVEGKVEGLRESALCIARTHVPELSAELAARIEAATDVEQLQKLLPTLVAARDEEAVRNAIETLGDVVRS